MAYNLPVIRPGYRGRGVPVLKQRMRAHMIEPEAKRLLVGMDNSNRYGAQAQRAIMYFQRKHGYPADGIVGRKTWIALGMHDKDLMKPSNMRPAHEPAQLMGIPWVPGVTAIDGRWVYVGHAKIILPLRQHGYWHGRVFSGYRPDWYQAKLYADAVRRYGPTRAGRYVAPPGHSNHRFKNVREALDVTSAWGIISHSDFRQVMSWEPWHIERRGVRALVGGMFAPAIEDDNILNEDIDEALVDQGVSELLDAIEAAIDNNGEGVLPLGG